MSVDPLLNVIKRVTSLGARSAFWRDQGNGAADY
jgi:hypothetical protein